MDAVLNFTIKMKHNAIL